MVSFKKRNKNQIAYLSKRIEASLNTKISNSVMGDVAYTKITVPPEAYLNAFSHTISCPILLRLYDTKISTAESDTFFAIGLDLSRTIFKYSINRYELKKLFFSLHKGPGLRDQDAFSLALNTELKLDSNSFARGTHKRDYPNTKVYNDFMRICLDAAESKGKFALKPSEFPSLQDRSILPIVVFNLDDPSGFYFKGTDPTMTYKKYHQNIYFGGMTSLSDNEIRVACNNVPYPLLTFYDGKTFQEVS